MAGKTKVSGTTYSIRGGKTKVSGTTYSISGGKTKVSGTNYSIMFAPKFPPSFTYTSQSITGNSRRRPESIGGVNGFFVVTCESSSLNSNIYIRTAGSSTWISKDVSSITGSSVRGLGDGVVTLNGKVYIPYYVHHYDTEDEHTSTSIGVVYSSDGITWGYKVIADIGKNTNGNYHKMFAINGKIFYALEISKSRFYYSSDGQNWSNKVFAPTGSYVFRPNMSGGNGVYLAEGGDGYIYRSTDVLNWTKTNATNNVSFIYPYFKGAYYLITVKGELYSSPDGATWTMKSTPTIKMHHLISVGSFLVGCTISSPSDSGYIYASQDAINWVKVSTSTDHCFAFCYANGIIISPTYSGYYSST